MAKTILEALQNSAQGSQLGTVSDETQRAQNILSARSGKALPKGTGPRQSSIAEQLEAQQGAVQQQQLNQQAQLAGKQLEGQQAAQQQQQQQQMSQLNERDLDAQESYNRQATSILNDLGRKGQELDFKKDKSRIEQAGFNMRLSNDQYVKNLKREGEKSRLTEANKMKEAIAESVFGNEQDLLKDDINFRNLLKAKDRSYTDQLANINLDFAVKLAEANNKAANERALWTGVGGLVSGGAQAYSAYGTSSSQSRPAEQTSSIQQQESNPYSSEYDSDVLGGPNGTSMEERYKGALYNKQKTRTGTA